MNHPLQPLSPIQRLGWLRHFTKIRCTKAFAGFKKGRFFDITVATVAIRETGVRCRHDGSSQGVILTGADLLIKVRSAADRGTPTETHRFLARPATTAHPLIHDLAFLVAHFAIPEIPDLALLHPVEFAAHVTALHALQK